MYALLNTAPGQKENLKTCAARKEKKVSYCSSVEEIKNKRLWGQTEKQQERVQKHSGFWNVSDLLAHSFYFVSLFYIFPHTNSFFFWLRWVFVAARRLSLVEASGGCSLLWCTGFLLWWLLFLRSRGSRCTGFSSCGARAQQLWCMGSRHVDSVVVARGLQSTGSVVVVHGLQARGLSSCGSQALEHRLGSRGARAQLLRGMWDLPRTGIEPGPPALAGGFLTTVPPGKSPTY